MEVLINFSKSICYKTFTCIIVNAPSDAVQRSHFFMLTTRVVAFSRMCAWDKQAPPLNAPIMRTIFFPKHFFNNILQEHPLLRLKLFSWPWLWTQTVTRRSITANLKSFVVGLNWPNPSGKPLTWNITKKHRLNYSPAQTAVWDYGSLLPRRFQGN